MILSLPHKHPRIMSIPRDPLTAVLRHNSVTLLQRAPKLHHHLIFPHTNDVCHIDPVTTEHVLALQDARPVQRDGCERVETLEHKTDSGIRGLGVVEGYSINPCFVVYPLRGAFVEADVRVGDREVEMNIGGEGGEGFGVVRGGGEMSGCESAFKKLHFGGGVGAGGGGVLGH